MSTKDSGDFCESEGLEGPTLDFCDKDVTSSYLRVYVSTVIHTKVIHNWTPTGTHTLLFLDPGHGIRRLRTQSTTRQYRCH